MTDTPQNTWNNQPKPRRRSRHTSLSVFPLLKRFAEGRYASFDDTIARFFGSVLSGYFDHEDGPDFIGIDMFDLTVAANHRHFSGRKSPSSPLFHMLHAVTRRTLFDWLSACRTLPKPLGFYKMQIGDLNALAPEEAYDICAAILAQVRNRESLLSFLNALRIDKNDFSRWVKEVYGEEPKMLSEIEANPRLSWSWHHNRRRQCNGARNAVIDRRVSPRILNIIDKTDLSGERRHFAKSLGKALVPLAKSDPTWKRNASALADYIHKAHREDINPSTLREWLRLAFEETIRLKNQKHLVTRKDFPVQKRL